MRRRGRPWQDRCHAGDELGAAVRAHLGESADVLVLGLPRGGVVVAARVASALPADLDVLVVRKVGLPWQPELALGAVTASGNRVRNEDVAARAGLADAEVEASYQRAMIAARDRERVLRGDRPPPPIAGRNVVVVDDGIATGATVRAAVDMLRSVQPGPGRVVIAVPVGPADVVEELSRWVDGMVVLRKPASFAAVGAWYDDFGQVADDEVRTLLTE